MYDVASVTSLVPPDKAPERLGKIYCHHLTTRSGPPVKFQANCGRYEDEEEKGKKGKGTLHP